MKLIRLLAAAVIAANVVATLGYADNHNNGMSQPGSASGGHYNLTQEESEFLDRHWQTTIPLQGEPPADFSDIEFSLDPARCGLCHEQQFQDWQTSFHAHAMGPGILGQINDMVGNDNAQAQICWSCHTPLAEQQTVLKIGNTWQANELFDEKLQHAGLICAACHVRQHTRYGPPRTAAPKELGLIDDGYQPHNGFIATTAFSNSAFCANCHQFKDDGLALNGKLLENTYKEWQESRYAEQGIHCQNCHMPDRRHTWRGIHDPVMTKQAIAIEVETAEKLYRLGDLYEARIKITNSGAGHYFPTYVTPKVFVRALLLDDDGVMIDDSLQEAVIGRETTPNLSQELYDTRIAPDDHVNIIYREALRGKPARLKISITVEPDHFYERFYQLRLANMEEGPNAELLRQALANARQSHFTLFEQDYPIKLAIDPNMAEPPRARRASSAENKPSHTANSPTPYWNDDDIAWQNYSAGLQMAKRLNKPLLLVFYADWCPTCHAYQPIFEDKRLVALSKQFVMVRVNSDEHPEINKAYIPAEEWEYVPRTFALSPGGDRMDNIYSKDKAPRYFLSAESPAEFLFTMQAALLHHNAQQAGAQAR